MNNRKHILLAAVVLAITTLASPSSAAPAVNGVSGTLGEGQTLEISGAGFGVKSPAAPLVWADFEDGIQPSSLGIKRQWDQVQSLAWSPEGADGTKGAKATDGSGYWTLRADYDSWTKDGQSLYIFKKERMNFLITDNSQNWKIWRLWPPDQGYPNIYAAANNGRVYVEKTGQESGFYGSFKNPSTDWTTTEIQLRASSAINVKDGEFVLRYNGREVARGSVLTRTSEAPQYLTMNYLVHGVGANFSQWNPGWNPSNRMWVDDVYADNTLARVMIGNAPTFADCTQLEVEIPSAWSDGHVTVHARSGSFQPGSRAYLYVFDGSGNVNPAGYPLTVGQAATGNVAGGGPLSVNAGADAVIAVGGTTSLQGQVSGGDPSQLSYQWTQIQGPTGAVISNPTQAGTDVRLPAAGLYEFRLEVNDPSTGASAADSVIVQASARPGNHAPVVNAGPGGIAALNGSFRLDAKVSDPDTPSASAGSGLTAQWKKQSGPGDVTFTSPNALETDARFSAPGSYTLEIDVSDGDLVAIASVPVNVVAGANGGPIASGNVFNPAGGESYVVPQAVGSVQIVDVQGRPVRSLSSTAGSAVWDGRNDDGEIVASGIYLVMDGKRLIEKVAVLK